MPRGKLRASKKPQQIAKQARKSAIRRDMLAGVTRYAELAAKYGVSEMTICNYVKEILAEMRKRYEEQLPSQKRLMEERLMATYAQAEESYQLSKQNAVETHTAYAWVKCKSCKGSGWEGGRAPKRDEDGDWCEACEGSGKVMEEQVTTRVKGQAGDSAHLAVKLAAIKEWNKLHGNYPAKPKEELDVNVRAGMDLSGVPGDMLLQAMSAMARLREAAKAKAIDVESKEAGSDGQDG